MKWPIVEKGLSSPEAPQASDRGGQPAGTERSRGEGGFYARIVAQDQNKPWRYAFIQQERSIDSTGNSDLTIAAKDPQFIGVGKTNVPFGMPTLTETGTAGTVQITGYQGPPGEMSVWNGNGNGPMQIVNKLSTSGGAGGTAGTVQRVSLAQLDVKNWAEEVNGNQSVPLGMIVWLRRHESYIEPTGNTLRDDYTFQYQQPIWAKITGRHMVTDEDPCCDDQYAWQEVIRTPFNGTDTPAVEAWTQAGGTGSLFRCSQPATASGSPTPDLIVGDLTYPAREVNGNIAVPIGQIVQLIPGRILKFNDDGTISDQEWLFQCDVGPEWFVCVLSGSTTEAVINPPTFSNVQNTRNIKVAGDNSGVEIFRSGVYLIDCYVTVYGVADETSIGGKYQSLVAALQSLNTASGSPLGGGWTPTPPYAFPIYLEVSSGFSEAQAQGMAGLFSETTESGEASITNIVSVPNNNANIAQSGYDKVTVKVAGPSGSTIHIDCTEALEGAAAILRIVRIGDTYNG